MGAQQKEAIYCIVLSLTTLIAFFVLKIFLTSEAAFSAFAIFGLYGLSPLIFYKKTNMKTIIDERDHEIRNKANNLAFALFWIAFVLVAVLIPLIKGLQNSISTFIFFYILWFGVVFIFAVRSVRILMLYKQGRAK